MVTSSVEIRRERQIKYRLSGSWLSWGSSWSDRSLVNSILLCSLLATLGHTLMLSSFGTLRCSSSADSWYPWLLGVPRAGSVSGLGSQLSS